MIEKMFFLYTNKIFKKIILLKKINIVLSKWIFIIKMIFKKKINNYFLALECKLMALVNLSMLQLVR